MCLFTYICLCYDLCSEFLRVWEGAPKSPVQSQRPRMDPNSRPEVLSQSVPGQNPSLFTTRYENKIKHSPSSPHFVFQTLAVHI